LHRHILLGRVRTSTIVHVGAVEVEKRKKALSALSTKQNRTLIVMPSPSRNQQSRAVSGKKGRRKPDVDNQQSRPAGKKGQRKPDVDQKDNVPSTSSSLATPAYIFISFVVALAGILIARFHTRLLRPPIDPNPDVRIRTFLAWLKDKGAEISPKVSLAVFPDFGGFGIKATNAPVQKTDTLFTIPSSAIITADWVLQRYPMFAKDIVKLADDSNMSPSTRQDIIIALYLMVECSYGEASEIWPYLQVLPDLVPRLTTFDNNTLGMLQDQFLTELKHHDLSKLTKVWDHGLSKMVTAIADQFIDDAEADNGSRNGTSTYKGCLTFESFHHYVAISSSRAMILERGIKYLTPLADMINHMPNYDEAGEVLIESFLEHHTRNEDGSITVRADRKVANAGEQIFEAYGNLDNSLFLESFGFVPDENPFHCAAIPSSTDLPALFERTEAVLRRNKGFSDQNREVLQAVFNRKGFGVIPDICVLADGTLSSDKAKLMLAFALASEGQMELCVDALEFKKSSEVSYQECYNYTGSDQKVRELTLKLAGQAYCSAQTTLEEDVALLRKLQDDQSPESTKKAVAVKFRLKEKKTFLSAASLGVHDGLFACEK